VPGAMNLELRTRHLVVHPRFRELCERHLLFSLGRFEEHVRRVQLWIEDVNGPRGGRDLRCVLRLGLRHGGALAVECTDERVELAIAEVFDRGRSALVRTIQRRRWAPMRRHLRLVPT
ncbi:MAG TPA: HPF/RaiA family ribosome-associated protein, partial [Myxococcaceae bacterium]